MMINGRNIGPNHPVYVIAELSANHNQSYDRAIELVEAARRAGADAVKIQTYTPETMTIDCENECFRIGEGTIWEGQTLFELYAQASTPWEWQPKLKVHAEGLGMDFFSTPFDTTAVEFLEQMDVPAYKIASFEAVDVQLIRTVAQTRRPMIISTGMASLQEIEQAVSIARQAGVSDLALLRCTSAYPSRPEESDLRTIPDLAKRFGVVVGLSDHTLGTAVPIAAVALGACIIEKHLTLSRNELGPDSSFSLEPNEFAQMVEAIRIAEKALGSVRYGHCKGETPSLVFRRSLFVVEDVACGEQFTRDNVRCIRPGFGLPPAEIDRILGQTASQAIERGTPMSWDLIESTDRSGDPSGQSDEFR